MFRESLRFRDDGGAKLPLSMLGELFCAVGQPLSVFEQKKSVARVSEELTVS